MFCTGRFYVDGKDYPMIRCDLHLSAKPTSNSGMVLGEGPAPGFISYLKALQKPIYFAGLTISK